MDRLAARTHLPLVIVAVGALFVTACSSSNAAIDDRTDRDDGGEVVAGGDLGVFRLQLGDCVQLPGGTDAAEQEAEVTSFEAVPCSETHSGEVVLVDNGYFSDLDEFPGEDAAFEAAVDPCTAALDEYTGTEYESSTFDIYSLVPTTESWRALEDRELVCIGYSLDEALAEILSTTGSIRVN